MVQFYDDDDYLCRAVAQFLAGGLAAGQPVLIIASEGHRDAINRHLPSSPLVTLLDARETLSPIMVGEAPDWQRFHSVIGGAIARARRGRPAAVVHAYGEIVELLWRDGKPQAVLRLEELWNDLGRQHRFSLLCAYVMGNFRKASDGEQFHELCRKHSHVIPTEAYSALSECDAQMREVGMLQQRARALENEIHHRRQIEKALWDALSERAHTEELVRNASRAKDEFLAMLGHELRNPLAPIVTALQVMRLKGDDDSSRERQVIERQVEHMVRLVDDLLDVSRITSGNVQLRKAPLEVSAVVAKAVEMAGPLLESRRHHLSLSVACKGLALEGDEARLAQVISNLLTNAARYTSPGGRITLAARRAANEIVISVKDNGLGIKAELLPRIFDLFVQGQRSPDRSEGGLGIGLSLVRSLVHLHGGTVAAASDGPGKGSEFVVKLPAPPVKQAAGETAATTHALQRARVVRRVLIVDDNVDAAELLAELLRSVGHEVVVAHDGMQALRATENFCAELAFLDIGLPVMDGYELAVRLRQQREACRLIALTGYGQDQDRARSAAAGFDQHLVKPVAPSRFLAMVEAD